jgi:hypothetical protein
MKFAYKFRGLNEETARFQRAQSVTEDLVEKNVRTLGKMLSAKMRRTLEPVKYTGGLAASVSSWVIISGSRWQLTVGPTAPNKDFVRYGTKPHWAPIEPLKRWAAWKLGDANAAYAIQKSIAHHGTSTWIERRGLGDGYGGYDYPQRTLDRGDVQTGLERTAKRISTDIEVFLGTGTISTATESVGE